MKKELPELPELQLQEYDFGSPEPVAETTPAPVMRASTELYFGDRHISEPPHSILH